MHTAPAATEREKAGPFLGPATPPASPAESGHLCPGGHTTEKRAGAGRSGIRMPPDHGFQEFNSSGSPVPPKNPGHAGWVKGGKVGGAGKTSSS